MHKSKEQSTTKKILMICYYYPPVNTGGVERSAKFARYLVEFGWEPVVLTTNLYGSSCNDQHETIIRTNELRSIIRSIIRRIRRKKEVTAEFRDHRERILPPRKITPGWIDKWMIIPDGHIKWCMFAFSPALRLLRAKQAGVIYTTSPPVSSHLLGMLLKKLTRKRWIMDMRDPWTFEPLNRHLQTEGPRLSLERRLERLCLKNADAVVINTPTATSIYKSLYPEFADKMTVITNGFDADEIAQAAAEKNKPTPWKTIDEGMFVISHTGTFCRHDDVDPTPYAFLEALKILLERNIISPKSCRIIFAGNVDARIKWNIENMELEGMIDLPGMVSHSDALRLMLCSDMLVVWDPNSSGNTYVHGKIYEYLGCRKPILAVLPDGSSRRLLEEVGNTFFASTDNVNAIVEAISSAITGHNMPSATEGFDASKFERKQLTKQLVALLDECIR